MLVSEFVSLTPMEGTNKLLLIIQDVFLLRFRPSAGVFASSECQDELLGGFKVKLLEVGNVSCRKVWTRRFEES